MCAQLIAKSNFIEIMIYMTQWRLSPIIHPGYHGQVRRHPALLEASISRRSQTRDEPPLDAHSVQDLSMAHIKDGDAQGPARR